MAANLSLVMDDTDKVRALYDDAVANGLDDPAAGRQRVELPLRARRSRSGSATGWAASRARASRRSRRSSRRARRAAPFRDLFDFCRRVDKRHVNRRAVEALVRAGAFDAIDPRRATLLRVGRRRARPKRRSAERVGGAGVAVRRRRGDAAGHALVAAREWTEAERLVHEKAALGFYLSGHPYAAFAGGARAARAAAARAACSRGSERCSSPAS